MSPISLLRTLCILTSLTHCLALNVPLRASAELLTIKDTINNNDSIRFLRNEPQISTDLHLLLDRRGRPLPEHVSSDDGDEDTSTSSDATSAEDMEIDPASTTSAVPIGEETPPLPDEEEAPPLPEEAAPPISPASLSHPTSSNQLHFLPHRRQIPSVSPNLASVIETTINMFQSSFRRMTDEVPSRLSTVIRVPGGNRETGEGGGEAGAAGIGGGRSNDAVQERQNVRFEVRVLSRPFLFGDLVEALRALLAESGPPRWRDSVWALRAGRDGSGYRVAEVTFS